MIIDAHVHMHQDPKGFGEDKNASIEELLKLLNESEVDKAVVLPIEPIIPTSYVAEISNKYPDKMVGFASVDPNNKDAPERLEDYIENYELKGLKLHPRIQNFCPNDPKIYPLIETAARLDLPIIIDTLPYGPQLIKNNLPLLIDELAQAIPSAKIIMAHMGGHRLLDAMTVARVNKNVYLDLSYTLLYFQESSVGNDIEFVIKKIGSEKVIYGSDHPQFNLKDCYEDSLEIIKKMDLTESDFKNIFGENIIKLLPGLK
jgi:predicted TIM-barrel fold metal-dependent hydrolase